MEVKPGYKQTEMGVIPEEWEVKALVNLFSLKHGFAFSSEYFSSNGPIVLTPGNFRLEGGLYFDERNTKRYSGSYGPKMTFRKGDLLIVMTDLTPDCNLLGKPAFVRSEEVILHNQRIGKVVRKEKKLDDSFLFYLFLSRPYLDRIKELATGSTVRHTSNKSIYSIPVALPTLPEQRAIAGALGDVEALLSELEKLIRKKRDLKQGVMQQLLTGEQRLPGFRGKWEPKRLGAIAAIKTGKKNNEDKVNDGQYPFFVRSQTVERINSYSFEGEAILVPGEGGIGTIIHYVNGKFDYHQRVYKISSFSTEVKGQFVYYSMVQTFNRQAMRNSVKATVDSLRLPTFLDFEFLAPSPEEQAAIVTVLADIDEEIAALERKLDKTRDLKQGMMQELLTGRLRLAAPIAIARPEILQTISAKRGTHNWEFNEAVVISVLVKQFGSEKFPLGRKRYTKLSYMLHRHAEQKVEGYLKKAAGPYNPNTKYKGPEAIAQRKDYVRTHTKARYWGFVVADHIAEAEKYFQRWYGPAVLQWLEQFRFKKNEELELLTTIDMAIQDLRNAQLEVSLRRVKKVIRNHREWRAKLERPIFADANIAAAMKTCEDLFS